MDYSAYSVLSSEQKERIRAFVGFCNARDHLYNEIYLGSEFKAYPEMKVFYLAQEGAEIVGFLMVYADDRESAEISACVLSSRRREGIFSALFQQAGMELKKYHYSKVLLKTEKAFEDQQAFLSHYPVSFSHSQKNRTTYGAQLMKQINHGMILDFVLHLCIKMVLSGSHNRFCHNDFMFFYFLCEDYRNLAC